jgi:hypothetical protein
VEAEMELAFAALQQLCSPSLDHLDHLPGPQRDALEVALGLNVGRPPNPFLAGLAALILLSEAAEEQPLFCLVDDAQWLDRASARVLAFVASAVRDGCVGRERDGSRTVPFRRRGGFSALTARRLIRLASGSRSKRCRGAVVPRECSPSPPAFRC